MSHFAVLVITPELPTDEVLSAALQPFHEFECTGIADQYVVDVDKTEEARAEYDGATERKYRDPEGVDHDAYDDRFYREWTPEELKENGPMPMGSGFGNGRSWHSKDWGDGKGYRSKVHFLPDGWTEVQVPREQSIAEWAADYYGWKVVPFGEQPDRDGEHKYGFILLDEAGNIKQAVDRTNPNKEWDWWVIGGRYNGRLFAKPGTEAIKGQGGLMTPVSETGADIVRRGDLDFAAMQEKRRQERRDWIAEIKGKLPGMSIAEIEAGIHADRELHEIWMTLDHPRPRGAEYRIWQASMGEMGELVAKVSPGWTFERPSLKAGQSIADWIDAVPAISAWAVLKDGEWTEKGSMGWWGTTSNEKDDDEWQSAVSKLVDELPDDHWIAVVDCHI
jgi:hypothetical protein